MQNRSGKTKRDRKAEKKFEKYYFEYRERIYWYIRKRLNSDAQAEDMTSEVFMKLLEHPDIMKKRDSGGVRAWLYTVARNSLIDSYRKKTNNVTKIRPDPENNIFEIITAQKDTNLRDAIHDERYQLVLAALESCSDEEKEIITLRFQEDMKYKEIGDIVGKEEGAVKMQLYRAIDKIKEMVKAQG
ncbi:sigma-70 family RNA polymerase sigma factor [Candidatus Dojkabacteria bacterium]|nr:sigma-70 family RNA polymerase sigma factor [Candidatus Dojkabacteria bacterium]